VSSPFAVEQHEPIVFYFDLASPIAYLAAERVGVQLGGTVDWRPVLARGLSAPTTFEGFRCEQEQEIFRAEIERGARDRDLQPLRWPAAFPFDSALAMRVATYSRSIGRAVAFAQAAFRQAFAGGRDLADPDWVLVAAAACEMHPAAVLKAAERASVADELDRLTEQAAADGIADVPAVRIGARVWLGPDAPEAAARAR
jgi:2-hydroxychromene-2-carboxylate isomerase